MAEEGLLGQLPARTWADIMEAVDIPTIIRTRSTSYLFYHLADFYIANRRVVPNYTLIISHREGLYLASAYLNLKKIKKTLKFYRDLDVFAPYQFQEIELRAFDPELHLDMIKKSVGVCKTLRFSMEHMRGSHVKKVLEAMQPERVVISFGPHATADVDAYKQFDGVKNLEVVTPDIGRLSPRLLRLLQFHQSVKLYLIVFSLDPFRRLFDHWQRGRPFGQLERLEVNVTGRYSYCRSHLVDGLPIQSLGKYSPSMTEATLLISQRNGLALLITDPLRLLFIPVADWQEGVLQLVAEFGQKSPVDASALLDVDNPLETILIMQRTPCDDDDWWN